MWIILTYYLNMLNFGSLPICNEVSKIKQHLTL